MNENQIPTSTSKESIANKNIQPNIEKGNKTRNNLDNKHKSQERVKPDRDSEALKRHTIQPNVRNEAERQSTAAS
jgi:hypothetical protein